MVKFIILYMIIIISEQKLELFLYCLKYCLISCQTDCVALTLTLKKTSLAMQVHEYKNDSNKIYWGTLPKSVFMNLSSSFRKIGVFQGKKRSFFLSFLIKLHFLLSTNALSTIQDSPGDVCLLLP